MTITRASILAVSLAAASCGIATAAPVELTYTGTVSTSNFTGANVGDSILWTVVADNGGSGLVSQSWS